MSSRRRSRPKCCAGEGARCGRGGPVGQAQERVERHGIGGVEPAEAQGPELLGHGVGADGDGPTVDGGLDRRVAEPLPGRREGDGIARRVGVGHRARRRTRGSRGTRRRPSTFASSSSYPSSAGPGEPVGRVEVPRPARSPRARPCGRWPGRGAAASRSPIAHVERGAGGGTVTGGRVDVERVVDRRRPRCLGRPAAAR